MCGRTIQYRSAKTYLRQLGDYATDPDDLIAGAKDPYDIPPGSHPLVILPGADGPRVDRLHWGLVPSWMKSLADPGPKPFNARDDKLLASKMYIGPINKRRCLMPVDGWYEWSGEKGAKTRYAFTSPDGSPLLLAGIFDIWLDKQTGETLHSFAVITREPWHGIERFHDRSPVIVPPEMAAGWLDVKRPVVPQLQLLTTRTHGIRVFPVAAKAHGEELLTPVGEPLLVHP